MFKCQRFFLLSIGFVAMAAVFNTAANAQNQTWQWVQQFGSSWYDTQNNVDEDIVAMQVDDYGNVYVAGNVWGSVTLDSVNYPTAPVQLRGFLAKFNCSGEVIWFEFISTCRGLTPIYNGKFYVVAGNSI